MTNEELYAFAREIDALTPSQRKEFRAYLDSLLGENAAPYSSRDDVLKQVSEPPRLHHDIISGGSSWQKFEGGGNIMVNTNEETLCPADETVEGLRNDITRMVDGVTDA